MTTNRAASIGARLKQHADATGEDFNLVLTRYGIERLLYRLATSEHATQFVHKGALLFALWYGHPHRSTRDADLALPRCSLLMLRSLSGASSVQAAPPRHR